jgi:Porin subfamily
MKMVKSLLLGSAAGLVAVTAGQAADLPVKAKPVEYVKVCSLYGAGFYYMPGTDLCIKIGGWVRAEAAFGTNGNMTWGPFNANANQRTTSNETFRARGYITADVRNQTEYGTVRGYIAVGLNTNDVGLQVASLVDSANRAFVQWAGMTAGLSQSFFDFYSVPAMQYRGGYLPASDTGDGGWWVWAYTAQFGGGFSGTISTEARRTTGSFPSTATIGGVGVATAGAVLPGVGAYGGMQTGDFVANLRVDQAWGGAQIMGAAHEVNASYYSAAVAGAPTAASLAHPSDKWGWAAGVGLKINAPFITQGDWFQAQVNVTQGALRYLFNTPNTNLYGTRHRRRLRQRGLRRAHRLRVRWYAWNSYHDGLPADLGLGLQRRLRALLDPGLAHLVVRRLVSGVVRPGYRIGQCHVVLARGRRQRRGHRLGGCCDARLQQQLVPVGRRLAHAVGRHQDVLPGRRGAVLGSA